MEVNMANYRRNRVPGGSYFFTVALENRNSHLLTDRIEPLRNAVRVVRQRHPFFIDAWVVLPDHMHAIWTLPQHDIDYAKRWRRIKSLFSKSIPLHESRNASRVEKGERGIWQRRYWEHTIRDDDDFQRCFDYLHINPLKHGLVSRVYDWEYSTFHRYVEKGVYTEDWGGEIEIKGSFGER